MFSHNSAAKFIFREGKEGEGGYDGGVAAGDAHAQWRVETAEGLV